MINGGASDGYVLEPALGARRRSWQGRSVQVYAYEAVIGSDRPLRRVRPADRMIQSKGWLKRRVSKSSRNLRWRYDGVAGRHPRRATG